MGGANEKTYMCVGDWLRDVLNKLGSRVLVDLSRPKYGPFANSYERRQAQ